MPYLLEVVWGKHNTKNRAKRRFLIICCGMLCLLCSLEIQWPQLTRDNVFRDVVLVLSDFTGLW